MPERLVERTPFSNAEIREPVADHMLFIRSLFDKEAIRILYILIRQLDASF